MRFFYARFTNLQRRFWYDLFVMDYLSLCLICKDENDYLPEWLDYHILMGVDRFYIYDNDSRLSLRESLKNYIERGWVIVVDIHGHKVQMYAYDHCLQTFGSQTFWLGFIDTDEFLVPKTTLDLKEFLRGYESYGALGVSSLFFGTNGHVTRPVGGQIASYTRRTHNTFIENELIKSIVQPALTLIPNSPHDFIFKENAWCVNEDYLRIDNQRFPNKTEKIQLNHYFCRSQAEIALKMDRGGGVRLDPWPRERFDAVNLQAIYADTAILQNLEMLLKDSQFVKLQLGSLPEKMAALIHNRKQVPLDNLPVSEVLAFRPEFIYWEAVKAEGESAKNNYEEIKNWIFKKIQIYPQRSMLYTDLAICYLNLKDPNNAWQALTQAWQYAPKSYSVLFAMAFYFLKVKNFEMADNTCRLLVEMAPHDLTVLGFLTEALLGQGRYEEAIKVGVPVVELSAQVGELPDRMSVFLVKKMADHLLEKKDYAGAVRLWEAGLKCQPGDINVLLELAQALLLAGDKTAAQQRLTEAQSLASQNETVSSLLRQASAPPLVPYRRKKKH